jgi:hypothetical protein
VRDVLPAALDEEVTPPHCPTCACLVRKADIVRRECPICKGVWFGGFSEKSPCLCVETRDAQSS